MIFVLIYFLYLHDYSFDYTDMKSDFLRHFDTLEDTRVQGCILHPMRNILFITIVGVFCGHTEHEESGLRDTFALGRGKHALDP